MPERKTVRKVVFIGRSGDDDWPSGTIEDVIAWFKEKNESVPEEYRDATYCDFDIDWEYDSAINRIEIVFHRPETDDEMNHRLNQETYNRELTEKRLERQERAEYERLRVKYGAQEENLT